MIQLPPIRRRLGVLNLEKAHMIITCLCRMRVGVPVGFQVPSAGSMDYLHGSDVGDTYFIGRYAHEVAISLVQTVDIVGTMACADGVLERQSTESIKKWAWYVS